MNREEYQQVKKIFQSALDVAPAERAAYLDEKCSVNPDQRREVERLLASYDSGYLEQPAIEKAAEYLIGSRLEIGQKIAHYKITGKIGAGGMGEVYLAEDTQLDRRAAIKVLPRIFAEDAKRMQRFVSEAKSASALNHPNIITIYEIVETDDTHFIATEYIEGETLRAHLANQSLSLKSALEAAIQVVSALDTAHRAGIIHRDIKPENLMIRPDSLVKILDFGIAKLSEPPPAADGLKIDAAAMTEIDSGTSPGMLVGTANYMSPEQARGKKVDARSDIFSFGIVFYEMLAGKRAFEGENTMDTIGAILHKEPLPLIQLLPDLPPEIDRIVSKVLKKDRAERYQTAKDLLMDLKAAQAELEFQEKLERKIQPNREEPERHLTSDPANEALHTTSSAEFIAGEVKKHKFGTAAGALILLALLGVAGWFFFLRAADTKQIESIAVMPFVNDSGNVDAEYLSDGMTETLISSLSRLSNLNVKARSTVFRYKGKAMSAQAIGKELSVQAVLNGRVIQRGDQITLTLELVDVQTENIIWSEQYNRRQIDLIRLQSEIARDVSQKLKTKLTGADEEKITENYTANAEAYKFYLQGRFYLKKGTSENLTKALEQFNAAVKIDPNYALAYVGLADGHAAMPVIMGVPTREALTQAKTYADRALELDDSFPELHTTLGRIHRDSWNWAEAEKQFRRAIELNPNDPAAHQWFSGYLRRVKRFDEALAEAKRANELDPLSSIILTELAGVYSARGELDSAIEQCRMALELDPNYPGAHNRLSYIYSKQGRSAESLAAAQKAVEVSQKSSFNFASLGYLQAISGNRNEALAVLKELEEKYLKRQAHAFDIAGIYAGLANKEQAFAWLEKAFQDRSSLMVSLQIEPAFESLHSDPRFKDLLRRMNLPE